MKWFLLVALLIPCWVIGVQYEIDLVVLHETAKFLIHDFTRVYAQNGNLGRYFYGPFSLVLIKPLGFLSFSFVKYFWLCLQTVCYFFFWNILNRLFPVLRDKKYFWGWFLVWIVSINPIHNNYQSNNIQLMLATLMLWAELWAQNPSDTKQTLGGVLMTLAAGIKVFPAFLVVYYFLAKSRATQKGILLGTLMVVISPFLFLGLNKSLFLYQGFFSNLTTYSAENSLTRTNDILCLPSLLARFQVSSTVNHLIILSISALFFIWVLVSKRSPKFAMREPYFWSLAWALSVFLNPSTRPHYFIFYVPAFCSFVNYCSIRANDHFVKMMIGISTLLIAFTAEGVVGKNWNEWFEANSLPTYGMAFLCFSMIWMIHRNPARSAT